MDVCHHQMPKKVSGPDRSDRSHCFQGQDIEVKTSRKNVYKLAMISTCHRTQVTSAPPPSRLPWSLHPHLPGPVPRPQKHTPLLEVLHQILHAPQLILQLVPLILQPTQEVLEAADVVLKKWFQVVAATVGTGVLLLQETPLGLQDFVLLLQEAYLPAKEKEALGSRQGPTQISSRIYTLLSDSCPLLL